VLQGVKADEHAIGRQQQMLDARDTVPAPRRAPGVDETSRAGLRARMSSWTNESAANPTTSLNAPAWSVRVAGESRSPGAVVTKAKYWRVWRPIVTVMLGVIDS
jgi:hypothetical protein